MLKRKLLLLLGFAMVMLGLSAGSMAYFTSEATSAGNEIITGTMYIGNENGERGILDKMIGLKNLVPGAESQQVRLKVKNLGTLKTYLKGISADILEGDEKFVANALRTELLDSGSNILFQGSLLALDGNIVPFKQPVELAPGETTELAFFVRLDDRAGNWYKGKRLQYSLTVYAFQEADQEIGGSAIFADEANYRDVLSQAKPGDVILLSAGNYQEIDLNEPGVTLKAKDIVYDTIIDRIKVDERSVMENQEKPTRIQGFTINGNTNSFGIQVKNSQNCVISDNIIFSKGIAIIGGGKSNVFATRNDLTGAHNAFNAGGKKITARYNLGDDLDPEEHAL